MHRDNAGNVQTSHEALKAIANENSFNIRVANGVIHAGNGATTESDPMVSRRHKLYMNEIHNLVQIIQLHHWHI